MIVLLDTHALIWALEDSPKLSPVARKLVEDAGNVILASVVSGWEIAIKTAIGRLIAPDDLEAAIDSAGFTKRMITFEDARRLTSLAVHHKDPFDRMLIAQAMVGGISIVTRDPWFAKYPVSTIW